LLAHMLWHRLHPSPVQLATASNQPPTPSLEELAAVRLQAAARGFLTRLRMQALREAQVCCGGLVDSSSGSTDHGFQWGAKPPAAPSTLLCLEINLRTPRRCRVLASTTGRLRVVTAGQLQGAQRPCHGHCCPWVPFLHGTRCRPPRARLRGLRLHPGKQKWVRQLAAAARNTLARKAARALRESWSSSSLPPRAVHGTAQSSAPRTGSAAADSSSALRLGIGLWWVAPVVGSYGRLFSALVPAHAGLLFPWDPGGGASSDLPALENRHPHLLHLLVIIINLSRDVKGLRVCRVLQ
jgi:hypothetical protein